MESNEAFHIHPNQTTMPSLGVETFNKNDSGKIKLSLIEPAFIEGIGRVLTKGAEVYGENNWKTLPSGQKARYKDALLRHLYKYLDGEKIDQDSSENHLLHIACNAMFLHYIDTQIV